MTRRSPACSALQAVKPGQAVEREMQLGGHAFGAEMTYAVRDWRFEMSRTQKLQQRARRIGVGNDRAGGETFSALQLDAGYRGLLRA